jgi:hypothetical protein
VIIIVKTLRERCGMIIEQGEAYYGLATAWMGRTPKPLLWLTVGRSY